MVSSSPRCFVCHNLAATRSLGLSLGKKIKQPIVVALRGGLGAGKTTFIQAICQGLRVKSYVTSPSFTLINEYPGRLPVYHIDLYRLDQPEQIVELGLDEYYKKNGVVLIEWAEKLGRELPERTEQIDISIINEKERKICLSSGLAALLK